MTKYRPGSQGAAEAKQNKIFLIVAAIITLVVGLCIFVFNTDMHLFAKRAGIIPNILGGICLIGSWVWLYMGIKNEWDGKAIIGWILLFLAGFLVSTGFNLDYFGL